MAANTILKKNLKSHITPGIIINEKTTRTNHTQTEVLHIHPNKSQFISFLSKKLRDDSISCEQSEEDEDDLIASTAVNASNLSHYPVTLMGSYTDLLVLLLHGYDIQT